MHASRGLRQSTYHMLDARRNSYNTSNTQETFFVRNSDISRARQIITKHIHTVHFVLKLFYLPMAVYISLKHQQQKQLCMTKRCALFTQNLHRKGKSTWSDGFGYTDDRGVNTTKRANANNTEKKKKPDRIIDPHKYNDYYELSWAKLEMRLLAKRSDGSL